MGQCWIDNKTVIITGASAGIGKGIAEQLIKKHNCKVIGIARSKEKTEKFVEELGEYAKNFSYKLFDVSSKENWAEFAEYLKENDIQPDVLINNAGVGELDNVIDSDWRTQSRMVDLNCRALTAVTTVVLPYMERGGFVLNVCSIASFCPNARMTVYSSTKAYVMSFSRGLREELRPLGINVLAVCPGPMKTEFLDVANITDRSKMFKTLPYSDPERVADRAVVLAGKGRCVYTPLLVFKFYRVLAKVLPHALVAHLAKCY